MIFYDVQAKIGTKVICQGCLLVQAYGWAALPRFPHPANGRCYCCGCD